MKNCLKLITLGDTNSGKSCIIHRYVENEFVTLANTIGVDFCIKSIEIGNMTYKLQIYDTSGQEQFKTITSNYYKRAEGILLIFDLTRRETYDNISFWVKQLQNQIDIEEVGIVLIGNKEDAENSREVSPAEGNQLAQKLKTTYFETSALTGKNVEDAFKYLLNDIIVKKGMEVNIEKKNEKENIVSLKQEKKKKNCCK